MGYTGFTTQVGWLTRVSPDQRRIDYDLNPNTAGRTPLAAVGHPSYSRAHNVRGHARQIWASAATRHVEPPVTPLSDSEEEEESEVDEPAALATRPLHLRVPAASQAAWN